MIKRKYIFLLLSVFLFVIMSCKDEKDDYVSTSDGKTRYTVIGNVPSIAADMISTVMIYEYNSQDIRIDSNLVNNPSTGTRYQFESNSESTHLKVKLISKQDTYRWGDTIIMLIPGMNVNISISITSPMRFTEPMLNE